jgi:transcriptional regulator with PAS, ATPase and Fis domain
MNNVENIKQRFGIIGNSDLLNQAVEIAIQVAPTEVSVLIHGENGTGKDIFSKIIHQLSLRKHKTFIAINCGAIPEGTIDSELFGHEKGSFTSAYESRKGYFEEANGGTIFLDEIAEMPLATQSRLLRVLENGEFIRVGSSKIQKTDVRIIAATNKNLLQAIRENKFREDLYFRLNTVTIYVPPLRERIEDLEILFRYFAVHFAEKYNKKPIRLMPESLQLLQKYHWPGNIRELRNFVEKITVLLHSEHLTDDDVYTHLPFMENTLPPLTQLPISYSNGNSSPKSSIENEIILKALIEIKKEIQDVKNQIHNLAFSRNETYKEKVSTVNGYASEYPKTELPMLDESLSLEKKEKDLIIRALNKYKNNRKKAASELGISERTLYRKIKQYDLEEL